LAQLLLDWFMTDVQPADPIIEARGELDQRPRRNSHQGIHFFARQFDPDAEAGHGWIARELFPEARISHHSAQNPLDTALAHEITPLSDGHL
jgi:hypothetical protein